MSVPTTRPVRERAVVIGASMAGLLAARVLADHFAEVVLVERDTLPTAATDRRCVPQGRHLHGLLGRGSQALAQLFPGIVDDFWAAGAVPALANEEVRFVTEAGVLPRIPVADPLVCAGRPVLEQVVRRRVGRLTNVRVREATDVAGLVLDGTGRVTGVRVFPHAGGAESSLHADLVVDAGGRAGRTPTWLGSAGYPAPREEVIRAGLRYVTARFRLPGTVGEDRLVLVTPRPDRPSGVGAAAVEDGCWVVTLFGYGRHRPSPDPAQFLREAGRVLPEDLLAAVRTAQRMGGVQRHELPTSVRRRYDRLPVFPGGLLVLGDAMCSFNPIYGQGMTVAALEALVLDDWLSAGSDDPLRFFRSAARVVQLAWDVVAVGDLALPEVPGRRSAQVRMLGRYLHRLRATAVHDPVVAEAFLRTVAMLEPPSSLFRPAVAARVARGRVRAVVVPAPARRTEVQKAT